MPNVELTSSRLYTPLHSPTFSTSSRVFEGDGGPPSESRVLIVMTGGTICMTQSSSGLVPASNFLEAHLRPRVSFNSSGRPPEPPPSLTSFSPAGEPFFAPSLRTPLSAYNRHVLYTVHEFSPLLDSSSIASPGWTAIAHCIQHNYPHYDGFVICHGTDSLAYTSSALSFILSSLSKPIILTGSQAPFFQLNTDATSNLLGALLLAGHHPIPEVGLFFAGSLYRGNRATKVSATSFSAFASPNFPPLATVDATGTHIAWSSIRGRPAATADADAAPAPLEVHPTLDTGHVACLRLFPGITATLLDAVIRAKPVVGLVLETFGAGNAPGGADGEIVRVLADAVRRDVVIVNVTQCLTGSVNPTYAAGRMLAEVGVVMGGDMTCEAALSKVAWLLARAGSAEEVRREVGRNLRGEMS